MVYQQNKRSLRPFMRHPFYDSAEITLQDPQKDTSAFFFFFFKKEKKRAQPNLSLAEIA